MINSLLNASPGLQVLNSWHDIYFIYTAVCIMHAATLYNPSHRFELPTRQLSYS